MRNLYIVLILMVLFNVKTTNATNIVDEKNADCVSVALEVIDVHEKYFGCLDADTASELYSFLFSACTIAKDRL